jgi:TRAP-type transport system periplasmic protein
MRVPATRIIRDCFAELGCDPVTINVADLGAALAVGRVDGHENPLAIVDANGLEPVTRSIARSNHIWSAFNLVANLEFWNRLSAQTQDSIHQATRVHIARQRSETVALNASLEGAMQRRGIEFTKLDREAFRARLGQAFYARVREVCGDRAWSLIA